MEAYLSSPGSESRRSLEERLRGWRDNHQELVGLFDEHPGLQEIEPVSEGLAELAALGLGALEVLDGKTLFSAREKRLHRELLDLHDPSPLDMQNFELPGGSEDKDVPEILPGLIARLLVEKLKTLEPLIVFRVKIRAQPGVEKLVLAAHERGTRDVGTMESAGWALYDHKGTILSALAAVVVVALVIRRRRRRRAA